MNEEEEFDPAADATIKIAYSVEYPDGTEVVVSKKYATRVDCIETDLYVYMHQITEERRKIIQEDYEAHRQAAERAAADEAAATPRNYPLNPRQG